VYHAAIEFLLISSVGYCCGLPGGDLTAIYNGHGRERLCQIVGGRDLEERARKKKEKVNRAF
jgi:hypothetical protein